MEIRTRRLLLRPVEMGDVASTHEYASDAENTRFMMHLPSADIEETARTIAFAVAQWASNRPSRLEFAIIAEGRHAGGITLYYRTDRTQGELGWIMRSDCQGRGYVTEAARALIDFAASELGMRRIIACCDSENIASIRVAEKLGMTHCSTGKRKNRSSGEEERTEFTYEIYV